MRLGIDASNLRDGGGITHLQEILSVLQPQKYNLTKVRVWAGRDTLAQLPAPSWLERVHEPLLDQRLPMRLWWQRMRLPQLARQHCDLLFAPGGICSNAFHPVVTMSRNLLPFEPKELFRYGFSALTAKFLLLRVIQRASYQHADGVIFLSQYARTVVRRTTSLRKRQAVIPHGINRGFFQFPRAQKPLAEYSEAQPFRLLYVSKVEPYKHPWHVVEAVAELRREGLPVTLDLIGGPARMNSLRHLQRVIQQVDANGNFIHYHGHMPYQRLAEAYHQADGFVFASTCENLPNVLLQAMAAGLPIASSSYGPMPEILGEAGLYFDPLQPTSFVPILRRLVTDHGWRAQAASHAYERAHAYSWERCAHETFSFLQEVATQTLSSKGAVAPAFTALKNLSYKAK